MSEDADALEQEALEQEAAHRQAFEARFQPDAFKRVASALNLRDTEEDLKAIGDWLLPYFYNFFSGRPYKEPPRKERIAKLKKLLAALDIVRNGIPPRASFMDFPTTIGEMSETNEFLLGKLDEYYRRVGEKLRKLEAGPARRGPKPKGQFRDFARELVRIYDLLPHKEAGKPYWLPDSRAYGGDFYHFAVAIWECLRQGAPQFKEALPDSEGALADELRNHWPKQDTTAG
jgi:hypothetical protein